MNCIILKGIYIRGNTVIGADSVVTKGVEVDAIYVGNPTKFIRRIKINSTYTEKRKAGIKVEKTPRVTVLMAVHNGMPYLPAAIESILCQTFSDYEFLIVNDCSTDETREVILLYKDPRIRLIDNKENIKQTPSLNKGLAHARCELVARMDDDDISYPQRLEQQVAYLDKNQDIAAVGSNLRFINEQSEVIGTWTYPERDMILRWMQFFSCTVSNGAVMFRKSIIWDKLGGYDSSIVIAQDWELWSRVLKRHKLANIQEILLDVRKHPDQETAVQQEVTWEEVRKIGRVNPERVLGIAVDTDQWLSKFELLPHEAHRARRNHPDQFVEALEFLYRAYCERYPAAREDPEVQDMLARQYLNAADSSGPRHLSTALLAFRRAWGLSSKYLYIYRLIRWPAMFLGLRKIEAWIIRRASLYTRISQLQSGILRILDRPR